MDTERIEDLEGGYVYERIRLGDFEREIKGPADYVERRMNETLDFIRTQRLALTETAQQQPLFVLEKSDTPSLADDGVPQNNENSNETQTVESNDLCTFYLKKAPTTKADAVKVITYFYQKFRQKSPATYEDFAEAYRELAAIGLDEPGNIRTSVRNAIANKHLHRVDKAEGQFALTYQGKEYVKAMGSE